MVRAKQRSAALRRTFMAAAAAVLLAACGGSDEPPPVELTIDGPAERSTGASLVILNGQSFVPAGSDCPASSEFIRIGSLGPHTITYTNAATSTSGPVSSNLWVCNAGDGRSMSWTSNPISLAVGANTITVTMVTAARSSSALIAVTRTAP